MLLWWVINANYKSHTTDCAEYTNSFVHSWWCIKHTVLILINISWILTISLSREASSSRELLDMSARSPGSQLFKKQQEKHNSGAKQRYIHISNLELYNLWIESHINFTHSLRCHILTTAAVSEALNKLAEEEVFVRENRFVLWKWVFDVSSMRQNFEGMNVQVDSCWTRFWLFFLLSRKWTNFIGEDLCQWWIWKRVNQIQCQELFLLQLQRCWPRGCSGSPTSGLIWFCWITLYAF